MFTWQTESSGKIEKLKLFLSQEIFLIVTKKLVCHIICYRINPFTKKKICKWEAKNVIKEKRGLGKKTGKPRVSRLMAASLSVYRP